MVSTVGPIYIPNVQHQLLGFLDSKDTSCHRGPASKSGKPPSHSHTQSPLTMRRLSLKRIPELSKNLEQRVENLAIDAKIL